MLGAAFIELLNPKKQIPNNKQIPKTKIQKRLRCFRQAQAPSESRGTVRHRTHDNKNQNDQACRRLNVLIIGNWNLRFGAWKLGFNLLIFTTND